MRSLFVTLLLGVTFVTPAFAQMTSPGKILIKLEKAAKTDSEARAEVEALTCAKEHGLKLDRRSVLGWIVVNVDGRDEKATDAALKCARNDKGVIAVDTITIQKALRVPDDEFVGELWGFAAIGADFAWDTTIGLPTQRVGVVDTGINRDHIDLFDKDERGFDFISDAAIAEDGNGRDAEYQDEAPGAGFHGSHVSGTIAASADDATGVPGLNWNAKIVTGRALGEIGGLSSDIVEAAAWMAGFDVPGVPSIGADRVSVINLSLGSDNPCSPLQEDVYGAIIESGVAVVAAAGNTDNFTPTGAPANCPGVIAVAAAGPTFELASYSNFDDRIDVVAPGGDGFGSFDPAESILSVDGSGDFSYVAIDGTSMACPHVTGVVSLMQAVNPDLSPAQIRSILQDSPFTCAGGSCDDKSYLDAPDAVAHAEAVDGELDEQAAPPPGNTGGGSCPANASPAADGGCNCNAGFEPNDARTACVAVGGGAGGVEDDGCPPNSTPDGPDSCVCDDGFKVNEERDGCVPRDGEGDDEDGDKESDEDDEDEDSDEDDDARASFSGCSMTGASTPLVGLLGLIALGRRRRVPVAA